jgi:mannose-6-phosphate isomerase-like protein (cupin superfamily)
MKKLLIFVVVMTLVPISLTMASGHEAAETEEIKDYGKQPWVVDIEELTKNNETFRTAMWTGKYLQMTVMSIPVGGEIGLEVHTNEDQFIRVEAGKARVVMGPAKDDLPFDKNVSDDWAIFIPAGIWHNVINTGENPLKVYVIYSPPEHPAGTVHKTFEESEADHHHHH